MSNLDILHPIQAEALNPKYYLESLMEQAQVLGLLSEKHISNIQAELLMILAEQTDKWGRGKSSSIPANKAQEILTSIIFVIGIVLKSYMSPEQAIEALKTEPLKVHFEKGLRIVKRKMVVSRYIQKRITRHLLDTPNVYYRLTIVDGINGFFKLYRPQFTAHEIHITADYPTYMGRPELDGIEFIEQYLYQIEAENNFCMYFYSKDIHHLLCGITKDYRSIPMNLFEPVLLSALGLAMLNRAPLRLNLTEEDIKYLYQQLDSKSASEIQTCLEKALVLLEGEMNLSSLVKDYITSCIPKVVKTTQNAVAMKTLDKVFIIPNDPEQQPKIIISYGERMDDIKYQKLTEKILQVEKGIDKVNMILSEVHSLADLLDILCDAELYAEDFELLVDSLPLSVLALLLAEYLNDDFLERENEQLLYKALQKRKCQLSVEESKQIEQAIEAIN